MNISKKITYVFWGLALCAMIATVLVPSGSIAFGAGLLVNCDGSQTGLQDGACNFKAFMEQIKIIINFLIYISFPITTLVIAYIGFKYMTAQGDEGVVSDSKKMIMLVLKGFACMLLAWLIIHTLIGFFLDTSGEFGGGFLNTFIQN